MLKDISKVIKEEIESSEQDLEIGVFLDDDIKKLTIDKKIDLLHARRELIKRLQEEEKLIRHYVLNYLEENDTKEYTTERSIVSFRQNKDREKFDEDGFLAFAKTKYAAYTPQFIETIEQLDSDGLEELVLTGIVDAQDLVKYTQFTPGAKVLSTSNK